MVTGHRHRRAVYVLMVLMPITLSIAVAETISCFAYIQGGVLAVYTTWTEKPPVNEGYPVAALAIGVPIGMVSGYQLWIWLFKTVHLLTEDELAKYTAMKRRK